MNDQMYSGTSILELHNKEKMDQYDNMRQMQNMQNMQYGSMQNLQAEQNHDAAYTIQQAQHAPYFISEVPKQQQLKEGPLYNTECNTRNIPPGPDIEDLAKDINDSLATDVYTRGNYETNFRNPYENFSSEDTSIIPKWLFDPLLIVILFVIISLPFVKNSIGKYIKQVNPVDATCNISITGLIIYGIILATVFSLTKKFLSR